jgi:glycerol uptake facilitator-like aquaporin
MGDIDTGTEIHPKDPRGFWDRVYGALTLDATVFEEVERDTNAITQAAAVVLLASVARGLGLGNLPYSIIAGFVGWFVATAVVWIVGVKILEHTSDYQELLRTLGFATAPRVFLVLGILPIGPLRSLLWLFVLFLLVVAFVVAVRQALNIGTDRAVFICLVAALLNVIPSLLLGGMAWL